MGEKVRQDGGDGGLGATRCGGGGRGFGGGGGKGAALAEAAAPVAEVAGAVAAVSVAAGAGVGPRTTPLGGRPQGAGVGDNLSSDEAAL